MEILLMIIFSSIFISWIFIGVLYSKLKKYEKSISDKKYLIAYVDIKNKIIHTELIIANSQKEAVINFDKMYSMCSIIAISELEPDEE